jgi:hypothetical protein
MLSFVPYAKAIETAFDLVLVGQFAWISINGYARSGEPE